MSIDISKLSVSELNQLITQAAERRANMHPAMPGERPQGEVEALVNPAWFVAPQPEGTLLQIGHRSFGWLAFIIPAPERALLLSLLLQQAILQTNQNSPTTQTATPTTAPSGGGGTLH